KSTIEKAGAVAEATRLTRKRCAPLTGHSVSDCRQTLAYFVVCLGHMLMNPRSIRIFPRLHSSSDKRFLSV
ncbi:hypothetical protein, partial [Bacillus subtilis]|uniref:hypothetical protein n=1 Tax=Bacillus subtilis TaxID=1423 RepID=UPI00295E2158